MKKIFGLIALTTVFTCCDIGIRDTSAKSKKDDTFIKTISFEEVIINKLSIDGIEYHVYTKDNQYVNEGKGGIFVINHTKEQLEVETLKAKLYGL